MRYKPIITKREFDAEDLLTVADDSFMKYDFEGCYFAATRKHRKGEIYHEATLRILEDLARANITQDRDTYERYVLMALRKVEKFHKKGFLRDVDLRRLRTRAFTLTRGAELRNFGEPSPRLSTAYMYLDMRYEDARDRDNNDRAIQRRENRGGV